MPQGSTTPPALRAMIGDELQRAAPSAVADLACELARRGGQAAVAVLYYGSTLRAEALEGVLDFYVLVDNVGAWPGSSLARMANRLLPPNVGYLEFHRPEQTLRAKYAVLSVNQFRKRVRTQSLDTTIWARFCQPALCVWARSQGDREVVTELVSNAVTTAAGWAIALGPAAATAEDYWRALFAHTYAAEVRVEKTGRPMDIVGKDPNRYATLLPLALQAESMPFSTAEGLMQPTL